MKKQVNILEFGAVSGSKELQTEKIQAAIDACRDGGGEVVIPAGEWHTASLRLWSHITLHLLSGAKLIASDRWEDYIDYHVPTSMAYTTDPHFIDIWNLPPHYLNAVITAVQCEDIAVIGEEGSEINGSNCYDPNGEEKFRGPMGMVLCKCRNVTLKGYTFVDSANWSHQIDAGENISISNIRILAGHDGFNLHHSTNVTVSNCDIQTGDDCFAGYDVTNLTVRNCQLNTSCNTFRIGGTNLLVENCRFYAPGKYPHRVSGRTNTLYAFEYYSHQADPVQENSKNWLIQNCTFEGLDALLHYDFGNEQHLQVIKPLEDVTFCNVNVSGVKELSKCNGGEGVPCKITFRNAKISMAEDASSREFLEIDSKTTLNLEQAVFDGAGTAILVKEGGKVNAKNSYGYALMD
jgi:polygalacturonase